MAAANPFYLQQLAVRLAETSRPKALEILNDVLTWEDEPGSAPCVAHAEYNVLLITAVRQECEAQRMPAPWA